MPRRLCLLFAVLLLLVPAGFAEESGSAELLADEGYFLPPGSEPYRDANTYISENVAIHITTERVSNSDVFVCDIRISSAACFRRAFGGSRWNRITAKVDTLARENDAVLAITGDSSENLDYGFVLGNGHLYRSNDNKKRDLCVMYKSGEMKTIIASKNNMKTVYQNLKADVDNLWQVFLFGPALLDDEGHALTEFNSNVKPANPRSVIGYYEPGHYCFVQVDGRGVKSILESGKKSTGLTLKDLAAYMESLGCACAYNLDGGQSSMLWFDGIISTPYKNGRKVGDVICIVDLSPRALEND